MCSCRSERQIESESLTCSFPLQTLHPVRFGTAIQRDLHIASRTNLPLGATQSAATNCTARCKKEIRVKNRKESPSPKVIMSEERFHSSGTSPLCSICYKPAWPPHSQNLETLPSVSGQKLHYVGVVADMDSYLRRISPYKCSTEDSPLSTNCDCNWI